MAERLIACAALAASALTLSACSGEPAEPSALVQAVIAGAGGQTGRPVTLDDAALTGATDVRAALTVLRRAGFRDTDPSPCQDLTPDAVRPAAVEADAIEPEAEGRTVRRVLVCVAGGEGGAGPVRVVGTLALVQAQPARGQDGGR